MKTDDLIRALSNDLIAAQAVDAGLWPRLLAAFALCVALVGLGLGYRTDLAQALMQPFSALRFVLALGLFAVALRLALRLAQPVQTSAVHRGPMLALGGLLGVALIWTISVTPIANLGAAMLGTTAFACMVSIPALSIVPVAVLLLALKRGATLQPRRLGAMAGLAGGGIAMAADALHCTEDNPLFYITWYGLAVAVVTLVSAQIGARVLRW